MPNGFAELLKKIQQATTRRTGQKTLRTIRKSKARGPARATPRAMFLTRRGVAPGKPGFYNPAVTPRARKARKAR